MPDAAAADTNDCIPPSAWSSTPPPFRASRSLAGSFLAMARVFSARGCSYQAVVPDRWDARRAPRPVPVVLAALCAEPAQSLARPVDHPRARCRWTRRRHIIAAAVHPRGTAACASGRAARDSDARPPAGHANIGPGGRRIWPSTLPDIRVREKVPCTPGLWAVVVCRLKDGKLIFTAPKAVDAVTTTLWKRRCQCG